MMAVVVVVVRQPCLSLKRRLMPRQATSRDLYRSVTIVGERFLQHIQVLWYLTGRENEPSVCMMLLHETV